MIEYQHPVLQKGRYQVVALTSTPEYGPADIIGYALVSGSGAKIWQDLSLEEARLRLDAVVEQDGTALAEGFPLETHNERSTTSLRKIARKR